MAGNGDLEAAYAGIVRASMDDLMGLSSRVAEREPPGPARGSGTLRAASGERWFYNWTHTPSLAYSVIFGSDWREADDGIALVQIATPGGITPAASPRTVLGLDDAVSTAPVVRAGTATALHRWLAESGPGALIVVDMGNTTISPEHQKFVTAISRSYATHGAKAMLTDANQRTLMNEVLAERCVAHSDASPAPEIPSMGALILGRLGGAELATTARLTRKELTKGRAVSAALNSLTPLFTMHAERTVPLLGHLLGARDATAAPPLTPAVSTPEPPAAQAPATSSGVDLTWTVERLRADLDSERRRNTVLSRENGDLARENAQLEAQLHPEPDTEPKDEPQYEPTQTDPAHPFPDEAATFAVLLDHASTEFPHVTFREGLEKDSRSLDGNVKATLWRQRTWAILATLEGYATRDAASSSNLRDYVESHPGALIPATQISMREGQTVRTSTRFRRERTFPVPYEVDPSGEVYCDVHVRVDPGGKWPAPRLYLHDDTRGETGTVVVTYIGPHLNNTKTT